MGTVEQKLIPLPQLARELSVTSDTLLRWHKGGIIELLRIGKLWFAMPAERDRIIADARKRARKSRENANAVAA